MGIDSQMGTKRNIRLKERVPGESREIWAAPEYLERSDSSISAGPYRISTDANGFISTCNPRQVGDVPVALIGGSFVESSFCAEGQRFIDIAERAMPGYYLLNGGYSGSTTLQLLNVMISKVYPLLGPGGTLVFFIGQSDADVFSREGGYWTSERLWSPTVPSMTPCDSIPNGVVAVRQLVEMVIQTARTLDLNLIVAISPFRDGDFSHDAVLRKIFRRDRNAFIERQRVRYAIRDAAVDVAASEHQDIIDFQTVAGCDSSWFYDDLHLNRAGHVEFAKVLSRELAARL